MAFSVSYIYEILDRYSAPLRKISETTRRFGRIIQAARRKAVALGTTLKGVGKTMSSVGQSMVTRITLVGAAIAGLALKASADLEQLTVSFGVMLRDMDKGADLMERLKTFAAKTPFEMKGVAQAAKTLLAFRVSNEELIPRMTMLGDIASGVNAPFKDIALIFGKVKAKGKLMAEELNQMSERGIPMVAMLAEEIKKKLGISMDKATAMVYKMGESGKLTFPVMLKMMKKMTAEGGLFNNMMALQSKTLGGVFSTLKDSLFFALSDLGTTIVRVFDLKTKIAKLSETIMRLAKRFDVWAKANPAMAKMALTIIGLVMVLGPLLLILGPIVSMFGFMSAGLGMISLPIVAIIVGVGLLIALFARWIKTNNPLIMTFRRMGAGIASILPDLGGLWFALGKVMDFLFGTKERTGALIIVIDLFGVGLSTAINLVGAFLALVGGDTEGAKNVFNNMLADLDEFRNGTSAASQIYDGMINRVSSWIESVANFFAMIKMEIDEIIASVNVLTIKIESNVREFIDDLTPDLSGVKDFFGISGDSGEETASAKAGSMANQGIDISGIIAVMGKDGSTIEKASIELNQGDNLATVM